jgi:hypothetical protein
MHSQGKSPVLSISAISGLVDLRSYWGNFLLGKFLYGLFQHPLFFVKH